MNREMNNEVKLLLMTILLIISSATSMYRMAVQADEIERLKTECKVEIE